MAGAWRRRTGRCRPGLSLIELIIGIGLLGITGALLMPRLVPHSDPAIRVVSERDGYVGIGAMLSHRTTDDGFVQIHHPLDGAPAEAAGLRSGDAIIAVDGASVQDESLDSVRRRIMDGDIGTSLALTIRRDGETQEIELNRAWIDLSQLRWRYHARW